MEKLIAHWTYRLGVLCLVIAVAWRAANAFGWLMPFHVAPGHTIWYLSFFHGSILFFVATIATACHAWLKSQELPRIINSSSSHSKEPRSHTLTKQEGLDRQPFNRHAASEILGKTER